MAQEYIVPTAAGPKGVLHAHLATMPRLPLPSLEQTCIQYALSVRPLASKQEFAETMKHVQDFLLNGKGKELHARLVEHARKTSAHSSWLIKWWNELAYFTYRDPVVFNVSYFYAFKELKAWSGLRPTQIAATLIHVAFRFRCMILDESLAPEPSATGKACSAMYPFMFHACRLPRVGMDTTAVYPPTNHLVVMRDGHFYILHLLKDGHMLTMPELACALDAIVSQSDDGVKAPGVGMLTGANRDVWARARDHLLHLGNKPSLDVIETSMMVVCLDRAQPSSPSDHASLIWHGDGFNRWYDKPCQFIVADNGRAGFLGEHSVMDGTPTLRMVNWCLHQLETNKVVFPRGEKACALPAPARLQFAVDANTKKCIQDTHAEFVGTIAGHDLHAERFTQFGKDHIKTLRVSPDAFAQLAIQLAHFRLFGHHVATYESCSTRAFLHGRTEVIRSCTQEASEFTSAMVSASSSVAEKHSALVRAANAHVSVAQQASRGLGVDRHLFGLRKMLRQGEGHAMFDDAVFARSSTWKLSTSTLASPYFDCWGFGEVVPDGFGVGYMVNNNEINFCVTSRLRGAAKLVQALTQSLKDMERVCVAVQSKKASL